MALASLPVSHTCGRARTFQPAQSQPASLQARRHLPLHQRRRFTSCAASEQPSTQAEESISQPQQQQGGSAKPCPFDFDYFHYRAHWPWWQQRPLILGAGIVFIVLAEWLEGPSIKTSVLASVPVLLLWYLLLKVLPQNFKSFATQWVSTHPEAGQADNSRT